MNKEEISKMTREEQIRQLEWSDQHEFSYWYAYYLLDYINQLETNRDEAIEYINNCLIGYEEQYEEHTFNYPFVRYDLENFLEILERGKE